MHAVYKRRARDPNNRMFLHVLNVNLDAGLRFLSDFRCICLSSNDCVSLPAITDSAMSEDKPTVNLSIVCDVV